MFIINILYINSCFLLPYACLSWYMLRCTQIRGIYNSKRHIKITGRWVLSSDLMLLICLLLSSFLQKRPCLWLKLTILTAIHFVHQQSQMATYPASPHGIPWACVIHGLDHVFLLARESQFLIFRKLLFQQRGHWGGDVSLIILNFGYDKLPNSQLIGICWGS